MVHQVPFAITVDLKAREIPLSTTSLIFLTAAFPCITVLKTSNGVDTFRRVTFFYVGLNLRRTLLLFLYWMSIKGVYQEMLQNSCSALSLVSSLWYWFPLKLSEKGSTFSLLLAPGNLLPKKDNIIAKKGKALMVARRGENQEWTVQGNFSKGRVTLSVVPLVLSPKVLHCTKNKESLSSHLLIPYPVTLKPFEGWG